MSHLRPLSSNPAALAAIAFLCAACTTAPPVVGPGPLPLAAARPPDALVCPPQEKLVCPPAATTPQPPTPPVDYRGKLQPASWMDLPDWGREPLAPALAAFARSCTVLEKQEQWKGVCAGAQTLHGASERDVAAF